MLRFHRRPTLQTRLIRLIRVTVHPRLNLHHSFPVNLHTFLILLIPRTQTLNLNKYLNPLRVRTRGSRPTRGETPREREGEKGHGGKSRGGDDPFENLWNSWEQGRQESKEGKGETRENSERTSERRGKRNQVWYHVLPNPDREGIEQEHVTPDMPPEFESVRSSSHRQMPFAPNSRNPESAMNSHSASHPHAYHNYWNPQSEQHHSPFPNPQPAFPTCNRTHTPSDRKCLQAHASVIQRSTLRNQYIINTSSQGMFLGIFTTIRTATAMTVTRSSLCLMICLSCQLNKCHQLFNINRQTNSQSSAKRTLYRTRRTLTTA